MANEDIFPYYVNPLDCTIQSDWYIPNDDQCRELWDRYNMPEHIRRHSELVAHVAECVAVYGKNAGLEVSVRTVRASALLHDISKIYSINHGGSHAQSGGAWVMELTGNPVIAQGVIHHVFWPFELDVERYFMPMAVLYADKRAMHDSLVKIADRFEDLVNRYGETPEIQRNIRKTMDQALVVERKLTTLLKVDLNEDTFDCGRLVR